MIRLAFLSVARQRAGALATALVVLVGTALLAGMAAVMATGLAPSTPDGDRPFLVQFPVILGSWILAIVIFAVVSTVGVALGGRVDEIRGLRLIGATPAQVQWMVTIETIAVSAVAAVAGVGLGYGLGSAVVSMTAITGVTSGEAPFMPGVLLPVSAGAITAVAAGIGAFLGSRAGARRSPVGLETAVRRARATRPRRIVAGALIVGGLGSSATALAMDPSTVYATAATGPGCVLVAVGAALFASELLHAADVVLGRVLQRVGSADARLAATNLRIAPSRIRPAATFLTLLIGVSVGTLSMQAIENSATDVSGGIGQLMAAINYLVVVLIAAFMTIALVNNLIASIGQRRGELAVMSSVGATIGQSTRMLLIEVAIAVIVSVLAGSIGAIVAVIPFAILKTGSVAAAFQLVPVLIAVVAAAGIALLTTAVVGRRTAQLAQVG